MWVMYMSLPTGALLLLQVSEYTCGELGAQAHSGRPTFVDFGRWFVHALCVVCVEVNVADNFFYVTCVQRVSVRACTCV